MGKNGKWQPAADVPKTSKKQLVKPVRTNQEPPPQADDDRTPIRGLVRFMAIVISIAVATLAVIANVSGAGDPLPVADVAPVVVTATPNYQATTAAGELGAAVTASAADIASVSESVSQDIAMVATAQTEQIAAVSADVTRVSESVNGSIAAMGTAQAEQLSLMATSQAQSIAGIATAQAAELGMIATRTAVNDAQIIQAAESITTLRSDIVGGLYQAFGILIAFVFGAGLVALVQRRPLSIPPTLQHALQFQPMPAVYIQEPLRTAQNGSGSHLVEPLREPIEPERLDATRPPTAREKAMIRTKYHLLKSKTAVCRELYGYKNDVTWQYVTMAVNEVLG